MKWILIFLSCLALGSCSQQESVYHDTKGNLLHTSDFKNKWIILNYWADWCDSCMKEVPELNQYYQHNQNKNIVILSTNYDHLPETDLKQAISKANIAYPVMIEDIGKQWQIDSIDVLPTTFIINPDGQVVKKIVGAASEKSIAELVKTLQQQA